MRFLEWGVATAALLGLAACSEDEPAPFFGIAGSTMTQSGGAGAGGSSNQAGALSSGGAGAAGGPMATAGAGGSDGGSASQGGNAGTGESGGVAGSAGTAGTTTGGSGVAGAAGMGASLTDDEVWPAGVNGPQVWPPELENPWYNANKNNAVGGYPEGGDPPPTDLITTRIKCKSGSRVHPVAVESAPWEQSRWHPPEYAFDEYTMSRWSTNGPNDKWLIADLGAEKTVSQVFLIWEVAYGKDYDLQFSNDKSTWTTAKEVRGGNGQADVIELSGKGRYFRFMGVATGTASYGYSLYELTLCAEP